MSLGFKLQDGGKVEGPTHEQGGIPAVDGTGQQVAEIEGGERIFSTKDTAEMEETASKIHELMENNPVEADRLATSLGHRVVDMIIKQEVAAKTEEPAEELDEALKLGSAAGDVADEDIDEFIL